jgi:NADH-quinone oxidoreductase subunit F
MAGSSAVLTAARVMVGADLDAWLANGGGRALAAALDDPVEALRTIEAAGLRGMGGAGYPTHAKWAPLAVANGPEKWIVCNGNEDEPGTIKDRFLLERTPHQVIEGALAAAVAVGASHVILYVNPRETEAVRSLGEAVAVWRSHTLFEKTAARIGHPLELAVVVSSGLYVGGEETAAIAAIEGRFPFPRSKPPFPAQEGVHGAPTAVNNVETFAHACHILAEGAAWYRGIGLTAPGTKLYSLSGDVLRPGLYELPMGTSLRDLLFVHGGGMLLDRKFKAVFTGGPSNTILTATDLDAPLDFDSLKARGARLGTGAMIVISEDTGIVRKVTEYIDFFAHGSCGQCPPCSVGTHQIARLLRRIDTGRGTPADLDALDNLCRLLPGSGRCGLIDGAVTVVASSLRHFRPEYEAQLRSR